MKIAVAVDGSEYAVRAAKFAINLAKHMPDAELEVIFVADFDKVKDDHLLTKSTDIIEWKREKKVNPVVELAKIDNIKARSVILKGKPNLEIIQYVNNNAVDHLVIGSRGRNTLQEMMLGSVSHKVVKRANCPVTVVK